MKLKMIFRIPILILILFFIFTFSKDYVFAFGDTVYSRTVAPGVIHTKFAKSGPFTLDVLEVDMKNPYITLESYRSNGLVKTTVQAANNDHEGHRVIGAVNGDFFSFETGFPTGPQIVNGNFVIGGGGVRSHLIVDNQNKMFIERLAFKGGVKTKSGQSVNFTNVNTSRGSSAVIFYNSFNGSSTNTSSGGQECSIRFIENTIYANDTMKAVIINKSANNMSIPSNGGVISASSAAGINLINSLSPGDTISVFLGLNKSIPKILQLIAGGSRILLNGRDVVDSMAIVEQIGSDFVSVRNPRTFFGFNRDSTKAYLCTVDGRQSSSLGMDFHEMAQFLISIGVWNAFNFDGGGSTTMVVRGAVVNSPSDPGGERSVANTLQVISAAPIGTLNKMYIDPRTAEVFQGNAYQFTVSGTDEYYNPISLPIDIKWECDPMIGSISSSGLFKANKVNGNGWVKVIWKNVRDSINISVKMMKSIYVYPSNLIMVPGERITLTIEGLDSDNNKISLPNNLISFSSLTANANVDASGQVTATGFGGGFISVTLDTMKKMIPFDSYGKDTTAIFEPFSDLFKWSFTPVNSDTSEIKTGLSSESNIQIPPALKISFLYPQKSSSLMLNTSLPISGRIDSIALNVYGAGNNDTVKIYFKDKDGEQFIVKAQNIINWKNEWKILGFRMNTAVPVYSGSVDYPVTITQIRIDLGQNSISGGKIQGNLLFDDLRVHYPIRNVAPSLLFDFESGITGWLTPSQSNSGQLKGIIIAQSSLVQSKDKSYEGSYSGKWTFVDDPNSTTDWDIRITRGTNSELAQMLRGSYVGAWVYAEGQTNTELQIVIRDGNGQICAGPRFPVNHTGWKLIGTKLDESLFSAYLTSGKITDYGNKFNGFRVRGANSDLSGQTRVYYIDKLVTSALTVPTGFTNFTLSWSAPLSRLNWSVNSEISIDRYVVERSSGSDFIEIGSIQAKGNSDTSVHYEFVDTPPAGSFQYRIRQWTNDGGQEVSKTINVNTSTNSVSPGSNIIRKFELQQNYPNPFNPETEILFSVPDKSQVELKIFNILGQQAAKLIDGIKEAGDYKINFNASNLSSGIYFYTLKATGINGKKYIETKKMVILK
jgi:hypothetical protein